MIRIKLSPLSYRIEVSPEIQLKNTHINLRSYLNKFNQTTWDKRLRKYITLRSYLYYDRKTETLYLPRYDFDSFCQFMQQNHIAFDTTTIPVQKGLPVEIPMKSWAKPRDERQTAAVDYLVNGKTSQLGLALNTGIGKTFCTIYALAQRGVRAMVCMSGLVDQWKRAIVQFTDLVDDDIYIIQGAPSLAKLLLQIDKTIRPKIILCSIATMRNYATDNDSYENYPPVDEIYDRLGVGIRVVDEAHLNFWANFILDLRSNVATSISLSATFDRGDRQVKRIFDAHYPSLMRFGEGVYERYVDIYSYSYSIGVISPKSYSTPNGYNHSVFEEHLLNRPQKIEYLYRTVYSPIIHAHYINPRKPKEKLLILCARVSMCEWFKNKLISDLPPHLNLVVDTYVEGSPDDVLVDTDIIISTPGSGGTGTDIKNLRTVLMTIATGSSNTNKQTLGRLRVLDDGSTPIYVYTWCRDVPPHTTYEQLRRDTYSLRGKSFTLVKIG